MSGPVFKRVAASLLGAGLLICLFLAWRPSPFMSEVGFIPHGVGVWADANPNLRTIIPFIVLGMLGALLTGARLRRLGALILGLAIFSALLEAGQAFIPGRNPQLADVAFGIGGALIGAALAVPISWWMRRRLVKRWNARATRAVATTGATWRKRPASVRNDD